MLLVLLTEVIFWIFFFRLEQTVESFEINYSSTIRNESKCSVETGKSTQKYYSEVSCDGLDLLETAIKLEKLLSDEDDQMEGNAEYISTSCQSFNEAEATKPINNEESGRLSVDQRSTCSPSTSNLNISLLSPDEVKKEPLDETDLESPMSPADTMIPSVLSEEKLPIVELNFHSPVQQVENLPHKRICFSEPIDANTKRLRLDLPRKSPDNVIMTSNGNYQLLLKCSSFTSSFSEIFLVLESRLLKLLNTRLNFRIIHFSIKSGSFQ